MVEINETLVKNLLKTVDAGLVSGLGKQEPGHMCVEAAVCYALHEPHGDRPSCVHRVVRAFKIDLNDASWSSNEARAAGMRRIAVAQLGSLGISPKLFVSYVAEQTIRRILPIILRAVELNDAALRCEQEGTGVLVAAAWAVEAAEAAAAGSVAVEAARAAAARAAWAAAAAARVAAEAAESAEMSDKILCLSADIGVEALVKCGAEGTKYLGLCDG